MRAEELRIGNWVYLPSKGKDYQIGSGHDIEEIESSNDANPIPLTEEWLDKFGFENQLPYWVKVLPREKIGNYDFHEWQLIVGKHSKHLQFFAKGLGTVGNLNIQYVHQLQNLYYALTNKELLDYPES